MSLRLSHTLDYTLSVWNPLKNEAAVLVSGYPGTHFRPSLASVRPIFTAVQVITRELSELVNLRVSNIYDLSSVGLLPR